MVKDELNKVCQESGKTHKDISLSCALAAIKQRSIRMYTDVICALYGKGPYRLHSFFFEMFALTYEEWMSLNRDDRIAHVKSFLLFIPEKKQATTGNDQIQEQSTTPDDQQKESSEVRDDSLGVPGQSDDYDAVPKESNFTSQINSEKEKEQERAEIATPLENNPVILRSQVNESLRKIPISRKELNIPNDIVSEEVMSKIFADAQSLLDDENSIKDAVSKSDDVKTVLNGTDSDPLIVKPKTKLYSNASVEHSVHLFSVGSWTFA